MEHKRQFVKRFVHAMEVSGNQNGFKTNSLQNTFFYVPQRSFRFE